MLYTTRIELRVCTLKLGNPKYKYGIWDEWNDFETQWMWHTPKECLNATYDIKHNEAILQTLNLKKYIYAKDMIWTSRSNKYLYCNVNQRTNPPIGSLAIARRKTWHIAEEMHEGDSTFFPPPNSWRGQDWKKRLCGI